MAQEDTTPKGTHGRSRLRAVQQNQKTESEKQSHIPGDPRKALSSAANDDEPFAAALIDGLRRTPTAGPLYVAAVFSIVWFFIGAWFVLGLFGDRLADLGGMSAIIGQPDILMVTVVTFLPIPLIWTMAYLIRRSKELRLMAQAMLQTTLRLTQPETFTRESMTSLGQAIRGEIAAMSEGVERALARAGELESMVKNEVVALERAYSDNEDRMKKLIATIQNERSIMSSLTNNVAKEMEPILVRLREETSGLHTLIEDSSKDLTAIEGRMSERSESINNALETMTSTASALSEAADVVNNSSTKS